MRTVKQIKKSIASIVGKRSTLQIQTQSVLCEIAGHALQHGDVSLFEFMYESSEGVNVKRLDSWIREFGLVKAGENGSMYQLNKKARKDALKEYESGDAYIEHLKANARAWFMDADKKPATKKLDVAKRIQSLAKQVEDAKTNGTELVVEEADIKAAIALLRKALA